MPITMDNIADVILNLIDAGVALPRQITPETNFANGLLTLKLTANILSGFTAEATFTPSQIQNLTPANALTAIRNQVNTLVTNIAQQVIAHFQG